MCLCLILYSNSNKQQQLSCLCRSIVNGIFGFTSSPTSTLKQMPMHLMRLLLLLLFFSSKNALLGTRWCFFLLVLFAIIVNFNWKYTIEWSEKKLYPKQHTALASNVSNNNNKKLSLVIDRWLAMKDVYVFFFCYYCHTLWYTIFWAAAAAACNRRCSSI